MGLAQSFAVRVLVINPSGEEDRGLLDDVLTAEEAVVEELATRESVNLLEEGSEPVPSVRVVDSFPSRSSDHDCLIVLGSPLGVLTSPLDPSMGKQCPAAFISQTERLLRDFHKEEKPVLGICLGAQLVARAFGGSVMKLPRDAVHTALPSARENTTGVEFGFHAQDFNSQATSDPLIGSALEASKTFLAASAAASGMSVTPKFMQWHSDTFTYPSGAVPLSSRPSCEAQAFRLGKRTYAFQYHIEVGRELGAEWYKEYTDGTATHATCGAEEAVSNEADSLKIQSQLQEVVADGSVESAEQFTASLMRSLLIEARKARREKATRTYFRTAMTVTLAVGAISIAMQLRRKW